VGYAGQRCSTHIRAAARLSTPAVFCLRGEPWPKPAVRDIQEHSGSRPTSNTCVISRDPIVVTGRSLGGRPRDENDGKGGSQALDPAIGSRSLGSSQSVNSTTCQGSPVTVWRDESQLIHDRFPQNSYGAAAHQWHPIVSQVSPQGHLRSVELVKPFDSARRSARRAVQHLLV
jgi:hypothetical protein